MDQIKEAVEPIVEALSKPVLGPITGWPILFVILYLLYTNVTEFLYPSQKIRASHILVKTKEECEEIKANVSTETFSELAKKHSTCPSGKNGGSLGEFGPGQMVQEFDAVCFSPESKVGKVYGPVKTQFGYHLILITHKPEPKDQKKKE
ncbi:hypothetical protein HDV01_002040 [Terramyces sp. JEL0728]|nr:hypothetical protein HDV01_002040 [Terramyces sp. JEL0728]